ncbi:hypothetical protein LCGC14_0694210 [marine sediment metagenome]|uniref:Uncharacterized protein n=1 Tax=marine sediment metagenome TaxID=412755 RepID=A0A0F9QPI2_9ZZZZ
MKKIIIGLVILSLMLIGCEEEIYPQEDWIIQTNSSFTTTKVYNGTLYYCFINNSYYGYACFPYTNSTKENIIDYENTTDYEICRIINETKQYCYNYH